MTKEILTAVAAATITAAAQTTEPVEPFRQPMPLPPPQPIIIKVPEQENLLPVQVVSADVKAEVNGCLSETTMELVFHNRPFLLNSAISFICNCTIPAPCGRTK
ncbi:MAG: hypothetical protein J6866_05230 [Victivallales bacterium]|nr:hypothetical protein [Victivallales bacterium]